MDDLRIQPIALEHAAGYRACLNTVAREKRYLAQTEALPLARIEDFVRDSVKNDAVQFVALAGDQVVGWADIFPAWAQAIAHCGGLGMGVHPDFRGRGIGEQLLRACLDKAPHKGITRVELEVRADNSRAIALYERLGFVREGTKRQAMCFDGVYHDALLMSRLSTDTPAPAPAPSAEPPRVTLREITADTVRSVMRLAVAEHQKGFVAPNAVSLAQALFSTQAWYRAVYADEEPVGFVMLADESLENPPPAKPAIGLWRFMIDARHQGRGIGRAALQRVIEHVRAKGLFDTLELSYVPGPGCPEPFYKSLGFRDTGRLDEGEVVLELPLRDTGAAPTANQES